MVSRRVLLYTHLVLQDVHQITNGREVHVIHLSRLSHDLHAILYDLITEKQKTIMKIFEIELKC